MRWIGVDGCRGGWVHVGLEREWGWSVGVAGSIKGILEWHRPCDLLLVDIPIGLPDGDQPVRVCDAAARSLLGQPRGSSVFPAPTRAAIESEDYETACAENARLTGRKITKQAWGLATKIREVDDLVRSSRHARRRIRETHPEVVFWALSGGEPVVEAKRSVAGRARRLELLEPHIPASDILEQALETHPRAVLAADDVVDAMAAAVAARAKSRRRLRSLPERPQHDAEGIQMEIVYPLP